MLPAILAAVILATPASDSASNLKSIAHPAIVVKGKTKVERLTAFILQKQPRSKPYAKQLAERIFAEGAHYKLEPAMLAAIAMTESHFWWRVRGSSGEFGIWQVWRHGPLARKAWDWLQAQGRTKGYPDKAWRQLGKLTQQRVLQDTYLSTAMGVYSIKVMMSWCTHAAKHRVYRWIKPFQNRAKVKAHRDIFGVAGHYNSGLRWPKRGYVWRLRTRTKIIRQVLRGR